MQRKNTKRKGRLRFYIHLRLEKESSYFYNKSNKAIRKKGNKIKLEFGD